MDRLTRKLINEKGYRASNDDSGLDFDPMTNELIGGNLIQKLGHLEDIEQELGTDLITLFKVIKQGYVYKCFMYNLDTKKWEAQVFPIIGCDKKGIIYKNLGGCYTSDTYTNYGKTWALTKEELENESKV